MGKRIQKTLNNHQKKIAILLLMGLSIALIIGHTTERQTTKGMMLLVEYDDNMTGLNNFVYAMEQYGVTGLLMVDANYLTRHCDEINILLRYEGLELAGAEISQPFWDVPYEVQLQKLSELKQTVESCTGQPMRIVSSRYMASDTNTIKAAAELGIPYVYARGTLGTRAGVYKVKDYNVKIMSVSNIEDPYFMYGSVCDYSFFERMGTVEDFERTIYSSLQHDKVTPVTHTRIGGNLTPWYNSWVRLFESKKIKWVSLDEFMGEVDYEMELWQVPINYNDPYTSEHIRPLVEYEDENKVGELCPICI